MPTSWLQATAAPSTSRQHHSSEAKATRTLPPPSSTAPRPADNAQPIGTRVLSGEGCRDLGEQLTRSTRDLLPGRENDSVAVPAGHAPLLVVVLVVGRV